MLAAFFSKCLAWSWWFETSIISVLLFGEYPLPTEEES